MIKQSLLAMVAASLVAAMPLAADEITDQINSGLEAYGNKDYKTALEELKFATAQIQELANQQNAALLPEALPGWTAGEIQNESNAMMFAGGGSMMSREYTRDNEQVTLEIVANSPMLNMMTMMINNPMMLAGDSTTKPYRFGKLKGMKRTEGNEVEITLLMAGQVMIKATGDRLGDEKVLEAYLELLDMDRIRDAYL